MKLPDVHHGETLVPASPHEEGKGDLRTFFALVGTMFQGGLSDNIFRLILMMLVITLANDQAARMVLVEPNGKSLDEIANGLGSQYQFYISVMFISPYILAVGLAGWLGDRFSKASVTIWTKVLEIVVMMMATLAFFFGPGWLGPNYVWLCAGVLFLMGFQSALFSPSRNGILPEILPDNRLAWGNGIVQGFMFFSIVLGTVIGPVVYDYFEKQLYIAGMFLVLLGFLGLSIAYPMRHTPVANPKAEFRINFIPSIKEHGRAIFNEVGLRWAVLGQMVWWMTAIMIQAAVLLVATNILDLSPARAGLALMPIVICQGLGCFISAYICRHRIEMGLVPLGAAGMCIMSLVVYLMTPNVQELEEIRQVYGAMPFEYVIFLPFLMGILGFTTGFFIVPLEAFLNHAAPHKSRGGIWATTNVLTASAMILGAALQAVIVYFRGHPGDVFLAASVLMGTTGLLICARFPTIPLRFMVLVFFKTLYRTQSQGTENVPLKGGALLAPNHQSFLDGILIASLLERPVRFIMSREVYNRWFVYPFAKITRSIAIEKTQTARELIQALREASEEIEQGGLVCIFPEGQLTRNGQVHPFRRGIERIMKDINAPIIPVAIDGAYETRWALRGNKPNKPRDTWFYRGSLNVNFGKAMPPATPLWKLRQCVIELMVDAFEHRKDSALPLHRMAIRNLRWRALKKDFSDHSTAGLIPNYQILAGIVILGEKLKPHWENEKFVGLLLPPSIGAMTLNILALAAEKIPVNLNYTTSLSVLEETCKTAEIKLILTSRLFVEKANLKLPEWATVLYLEDIRSSITKQERIRGLWRGLLLPVESLENLCGRNEPAKMDDLATLIFSSGSTGTPKGVMLSHWNVFSNISGTIQYVDIPKNARVLGILPFFHSFGYTATLWLTHRVGIGASFYPNPLDAKMVGATVAKYRVTHLFGTPTFLSNYTRRVEPGQFGSLRFVLAGAEKLKDFIAEGFRERFGIMPLEGFGCTECSPVVSLNGEDWREPGIYQVGQKRGTIGQPIPGVAIKIVDLESGEVVAPGASGMLLVRGHNVMQGYYKMPEKTAEALVDGWYRTGDLATQDEDGFVKITDRLARFSKIGGEMVPHIRIEEALQQVVQEDESVFAVTAVPDEKRGERLVVLYTIDEEKAKAAAEALSSPEMNLPPLWQPKWADFIKIKEIPALGSGKMDLRRMKEMAAERGVGVEV